ncbi:MAG: hypothetical protein HWD61_10900 [Parachlamydiaceae bacterium]|nr:MAG: hypothetical protein HWD61_10900 [Parachlamydiaceae bacterium]
MIEKIEALRNQEDPELQKCFNRLRKEAAKELDREPENLQEILDYGIKPPYFSIKVDGWPFPTTLFRNGKKF